MSKRAKRLASYLEKELGWQVYDDTKTCICGSKSYGDDFNYCRICGAKLKNNSISRSTTIDELESAIEYALSENK